MGSHRGRERYVALGEGCAAIVQGTHAARMEIARSAARNHTLALWTWMLAHMIPPAEVADALKQYAPPVLDLFAGGGSIPLEAQRLGLEAHASDLNPVAVLINKAMIEIPPKFENRPPVYPNLPATLLTKEWKGAEGLAEDVRYGQWMRDEAFKRIGHLYPKITLPKEQVGGGDGCRARHGRVCGSCWLEPAGV